MTRALVVSLALLPAASLAGRYDYEPDEDTFTNRVFVAVTNGVLDSYFLTIDFATELPPPYLVGLYDALDIQFAPSPSSRRFPLRYKVVDGKRATLACDVRRLPHGVFVQVLPVSWTNAPGFRVLAPDEVAARHVLADCCANGAAPFERGELARQWRGRSIYEGCSQEVPIFRPFRGLSVRDGLVFALDWTGIPRPAVAPTNAVPGRIYWEGLE